MDYINYIIQKLCAERFTSNFLLIKVFHGYSRKDLIVILLDIFSILFRQPLSKKYASYQFELLGIWLDKYKDNQTHPSIPFYF